MSQTIQHVHQIANYLTLLTSRLQAIVFASSHHVGEFKLSSKELMGNGWVLCDGRSLDRITYRELFEVIGTAYGYDSDTTFRVPDFRGRALGAAGAGSNLTPRALGDMVGSETHTLTTNQLPSHTHTATSDTTGAHVHTITDPGHTHTQTTINDDFNNSGANPPGFASDSSGERTWNNINSATTGITVNSAGAHSHVITINPTGSNHSFPLMQPTAFGAHVFIYSGVVEQQD